MCKCQNNANVLQNIKSGVKYLRILFTHAGLERMGVDISSVTDTRPIRSGKNEAEPQCNARTFNLLMYRPTFTYSHEVRQSDHKARSSEVFPGILSWEADHRQSQENAERTLSTDLIASKSLAGLNWPKLNARSCFRAVCQWQSSTGHCHLPKLSVSHPNCLQNKCFIRLSSDTPLDGNQMLTLKKCKE